MVWSKAELFVQHLVGSRESEGAEPPDGTIVTDEPLKGYGETCGETEATNTSREDFILILLALATEETFAGYSYDLQTNTILAKEGGTLNERRHLTTVCDEYDLRVLVTKYDVATACSCFGSLLTALPFGSREVYSGERG